MANHEQAIITYLLNCPSVKNSSLYFNFIDAKDDNKQYVTTSNEKATNKPFIDGSVEKQYTFTIIDYRSIAYRALPKGIALIGDENIEEYLDVQGIIDWITEQEELKNYPDFGSDHIIEKIEALTENPNLNGVNTSVTPPLAKYSVAIRVTYTDMSKVTWNK